MSRRLQQTVYATIRRAKEKYPQEFTLLTNNDDDRVFEAIEEHSKSIYAIMIYTRFNKMRVLDALQRLIAAGYVKSVFDPHEPGHRVFKPVNR